MIFSNIVISLFSCHSESDLELPNVIFEYDRPHIVSEDFAKTVAMAFFQSDSIYNTGRNGKKTPKIREVSRLSLSDSIKFEAFVINDMDGFVIISGDSRIMPILAFSPVGKISKMDLEQINGLQVWYRETMQQIDQQIKNIERVHPIVYNEWKKYSSNFDPNGRIFDNSIANYPNTNCYEWHQYGQFICNPYMTVYERQPLYSNRISWGQSGISNYNAPANSDCNCGKSSIGCGPVAIAQTLWHFKPGPYSYTTMPTSSNIPCAPSTTGEFHLALLMKNSATAASTWFNFGGCNGMTYPWNISPALATMGLQSGGNTSNFNPWLLNNELYQGYPAIFYGHDGIFNWHIWTCDGFKQHNYKSYNCDTDSCMEWSYAWYYMNWGWNGGSNGWFSTGNFAPNGSQGANYNNGLKMITGIR